MVTDRPALLLPVIHKKSNPAGLPPPKIPETMELRINNKNHSYLAVSYGEHLMDNTPVLRDLVEVLRTSQRDRKVQELVRQIRKTHVNGEKSETKKLKKKLPCITAPGIFDGSGTTKAHLIGIAPIIPVEVDLLGPMDAVECRNLLSRLLGPNAYYFGVTPSGDGVRGFVRIEDPDAWEDHWEALSDRIGGLGYELDKMTKNPAQKYYLTYDPDAFFGNPDRIEPFREKGRDELPF